MQAIILAAGMGKRLGALTQNNTKCMVKVNGVTLIERLLHQLERVKAPAAISRIVIVTGYEGQKLRDYISTLNIQCPIEYVDNPIYATTNNIYSLSLAKEYLLQEDSLLFESDLIFEDKVIDRIIQNPYTSLALVDKFESWMDGTVVTLDEEDNIRRFIPGSKFSHEETEEYYKTVNIYKFSKEFSSSHYVPFLTAYSKALGNNEYYEQVLRVIALLDKPEIKALRLNGEAWYEIDDVQDLDIAESMFCQSDERFRKMEERRGGYWRYPHILDFSYPANPYFPNARLMSELKANFDKLVCQHPSDMSVNSLLASKNFAIKQDYTCVANGVTELIQALLELSQGNTGIIHPGFDEFPWTQTSKCVVYKASPKQHFAYTAGELIKFFENKDIHQLLLVNPDNTSGNFISFDNLMHLVEWSHQKELRVIIDESYVDFTEQAADNTLLKNEILSTYPHLVIVKSLSISHGVSGLRLGVLASGDENLISKLKGNLPLWNINSIAEFYLQIFGKYEKSYRCACAQLIESRQRLMQELSTIHFLKVVSSQANYFLCEVLSPYTAQRLAEFLLEKHNILIKRLTCNDDIPELNYIRISVKTEHENATLVRAMKELCSE